MLTIVGVPKSVRGRVHPHNCSCSAFMAARLTWYPDGVAAETFASRLIQVSLGRGDSVVPISAPKRIQVADVLPHEISEWSFNHHKLPAKSAYWRKISAIEIAFVTCAARSIIPRMSSR